MNTDNYQTLIFDCDGVILNSNEIKTQAFYEATKHLGHDKAQALKDYHVQNGGVSRYVKMKYFITDILKRPIEQTLLNDLLLHFSTAVKQGLMSCEVAEGLDQLKEKMHKPNWLIVSGSDQAELREVFAVRDLDHYFNGGIFGSPDTKDIILARELQNGNIAMPALFFGDSKYDYYAARAANIDFVFLTKWTELQDFYRFIKDNNIYKMYSLQEVI